MKVMNGLVMTLEEDEIFMCLAALLCEQFCRFANEVPCEQSLFDLPRSTDLGRSKRLCSQGTNEGAKISIKSNFMRSFFSQCIQQQ